MQKVAVVTSRLRRLISPEEPWLVALRGTLRKIAADQHTLVVVSGTAGSNFVLHGATQLGVLCELVEAPSETTLSPTNLPQRDQIVNSIADLVYVLTLRSGGNLHRVLRDRLQHRRGAVVFVDIPGLQDEAARRELCELGATAWRPATESCRAFESLSTTVENALPTSGSSDEVYLITPFPKENAWEMLTHTTRSCSEPWPDQSFDSYADHLFQGHPDADHSSLGTLRRIVCQRRLIASSRTIRGGHRVVSFTACPLERLPTLHQFRAHRVRWDFEPYGICLRREWLQSLGARPVSYGKEEEWNSLPEVDRPFFQLARGESGIDWTIEQEWRHLGDLDLSHATASDVLLFVPSFEAAKSLAKIVSWPVTLWPGCDRSSARMQK